MNEMSEWLITEAWEAPLTTRRGDPLGFHVLANEFSDLLTPELTNITKDARWFTILSWCLCISQNAPWNKGKKNEYKNILKTREGAMLRYQWLRPLELLWIARTNLYLKSDTKGKGYQLRGILSVKKWCENGCKQTDTQFQMSDEQWKRYRQTGMYGGYRSAFRKLPGLTKDGDGWTPGENAKKLAKIVENKFKKKLPLLDNKISTNAKIESYWFSNVWKDLRNIPPRFLPESNNNIKPLPEKEREILKSIIFGDDENGKRRKRIAIIASSSNSITHSELCLHISTSLSSEKGLIELLPIFTDFSDVAIDILTIIWKQFDSNIGVTCNTLSRNKEIISNIKLLKQYSEEWVNVYTKSEIKFDTSGLVTQLAQKLKQDNVSNKKIIRILIKHHSSNGGNGGRWMRLEDEKVYRITGAQQGNTSYYRFRLHQLCRMAIQCGVIKKIPPYFDDDDDDDDEDDDE